MQRIIGLLALLLIAVSSFAKPIREVEKPVFDLQAMLGESNWGTVSYDRSSKTISIKGHETWDAEGVVRADGSIFLLWTLKATGEPAPGLYHIKDLKLDGHWNYASKVITDENGEMQGLTYHDQVYKLTRQADSDQ